MAKCKNIKLFRHLYLMIENASSNRKLFEQLHINIGFNRLEFYTKENFKIKYKIMPVAFVTTFISAIDSKPECESNVIDITLA